jgi:hypothetical protein
MLQHQIRLLSNGQGVAGAAGVQQPGNTNTIAGSTAGNMTLGSQLPQQMMLPTLSMQMPFATQQTLPHQMSTSQQAFHQWPQQLQQPTTSANFISSSPLFGALPQPTGQMYYTGSLLPPQKPPAGFQTLPPHQPPYGGGTPMELGGINNIPTPALPVGTTSAVPSAASVPGSAALNPNPTPNPNPDSTIGAATDQPPTSL